MGWLHARCARRPAWRERGQGTVEYVALILLVAAVLAAVVAAAGTMSAATASPRRSSTQIKDAEDQQRRARGKSVAQAARPAPPGACASAWPAVPPAPRSAATARSPSSTRASAASPSCTSCSSRCRTRTSSTSATPRAFPTASGRQDELERFALEIAEELLARRAKLLVVACNSATAAALPALRDAHVETTLRRRRARRRSSPRPCRRSTATRNGRIGLLATPATVASGAYAEAVAAADPHVDLDCRAVPGPGADHPGRVAVRRAHRRGTIRGYSTPLREAGVDTVILGCTHYPLVARCSSGCSAAASRSSPPAPRSRGRSSTRSLPRPGPRRTGEGDYRFLCTGDTDAFRALGTRFLQMPLGEVAARRAEPLHGGTPRDSERDRDGTLATGAPRTGCARPTIEPGFVRTATGLGADQRRRDARHLHRVGRGERAALDGRPGQRLGHGRVRDAPRLDRRAQAARRHEGPPRRAHGRDPAADRPLAARRRGLRGARREHDLARLRRADRPTAARAARRSPAPTSRSRSPATCSSARAIEALAADGRDRGGVRAGSSAASRCSTSTTPRTRPPRSTRTS